MKVLTVVLVVCALVSAAALGAHEMTIKGMVAAIEAARIQVKTGLEKEGVAPAWYPISTATKVRRGDKAVPLAEARIAVDERVVLIVDHPDKGPVKTLEIRLAAR